MSERWIRLNVGTFRSEWLAPLHPIAQHAWTCLLLYMKESGRSGRVKALGPAATRKAWGVAPNHRESMLTAAHSGEQPALRTEDGFWVVANWAKYQEPDLNASERKRRQREREKVTEGHGESRRDTQDTGRDTPVTEKSRDVTRDTVTRPPTVDRTSTAARARDRTRWRVCPADWKPTDEHATLAAQLHVNLHAEEAKFRDHEFDKPKTDPNRTFANWIRNASEFRANGNGGKNGHRPPKRRKVGPNGEILSA